MYSKMLGQTECTCSPWLWWLLIWTHMSMIMLGHTCTHKYMHIETPNRQACVLESIWKKPCLPCVFIRLRELGSGMFSRLWFGVRLRGDRATINLTVHLGSLKPETARQFINLNLLALQLDREDLWEALTGPRCSSFSCYHTHQQRRYSSHPRLPQPPSCLSSWPWAWC